MIASQAFWIVGGLAALVLLIGGAMFLLIVGLIAFRWIRNSAAEKGINLADGLDEQEMQIIANMIRRTKQTEAEQSAVATLQATADIHAPPATKPARTRPATQPAAVA